MLPTIELDNKTGIGATEIDNISVNWNLSLEFQAAQPPPAKLKPKHALGVGLLATKPFGDAYVSTHRRSPLTPTLSPPGRGSSPASGLGFEFN